MTSKPKPPEIRELAKIDDASEEAA